MAATIETYVRETDAFTFRMERDPLLRSTIVAISTLDRSPDWDLLVERIERATLLAPRFRERLEPAPLGLAPPRWVLDPNFDLTWHLRRVGAPPGRNLAGVLELARIAGTTAFDPARPLWEFTLVEGLRGGRAALVMKVHHALTDGLGGVDIAAHVVDFQREPGDLGSTPPVPLPSSHGAVAQAVDAVGFDLARARGMAGVVAGLPGALLRAGRAPVRTIADITTTAWSLARFVRPVTSTLSPLMTERRPRWDYQVLDVPFAELKRAAHSVDGTVNDAFLAAVTGGFRRYHHRHGASVDGLRVTMPISLREAGDPVGGNRITLVRFEIPTGIADPAQRMVAIASAAKAQRREPALRFSEAVAGVMNLLPAAVTGGMLKHVDFIASNVPGLTDPVYVGGARVDAFYGLGPTIGAAANVTLMSYQGTCNIGLTTDSGAVPDPAVLLACLAEGFDEVIACGAAQPSAGGQRIRGSTR